MKVQQRKLVACTLLLSLFVLNACRKSSQDSVEELGKRITYLENNATILSGAVSTLKDSAYRANFGILDTSSKDFSSLRTDLGTALVAVKDISKHAAGYKVTFKIGNTSAIDWVNPTFTITWGKIVNYGAFRRMSSEEGEKNSKVVTMLGKFPSGMWTIVNVSISPVREEEIGLLEVSLDPAIVQLGTNPRRYDF